MRYFLECSYLGANYGGWQVQNNAISVQSVIENRLSQILQSTVSIYGSSRTDAGVHARHQVAHFDVDEINIKFPLLIYKLNRILPNDISISKIYAVEAKAHARFDAVSRKYIYRISKEKNPFIGQVSHFFSLDLDLNLMNEACELLKHKNLDCEIFSKTQTSVKTFFCDIYEAKWVQEDSIISFTIEANRFLRGMVRIIVGYMLQIGLKKISVDEFKDSIENKIFKSRPSLAPSHGLTLERVKYSSNRGLLDNEFYSL